MATRLEADAKKLSGNQLLTSTTHMPLDLSYVAGDRQISDAEIITAFAALMGAMRQRGIIRTKNVVGDLGERYAEMIYKTQGGRGPISLVGTNSMDVDAKDSTGRLYSIKAASPSTTRTGAFHLEKDHREDNKTFDYLVVVRVNELLQPSDILEFSWSAFWTAKKWNIREKAWFLPLSQKVLKMGTRLFLTEESNDSNELAASIRLRPEEDQNAPRRNAMIAALYLARFNHELLEFGNQGETIVQIAQKLSINANTLRNYRDYFDAKVVERNRRGWQTNLPPSLAVILSEFGNTPEPQMREMVLGFLH